MPSQIQELHEVLRKAGQRLTPQRMMVLSVLAEQGGHMGAEEILALVRQEYPYLNLSTVYRTLDLFVELGLVAQTDLGEGVRQFELVGSHPHHHLICRQCSGAVEVGDDLLGPLRQTLREQFGFEACMDHFAIFGICRSCRDQPNS
jgi:Fur family ferric uptake transcriptional regulator